MIACKARPSTCFVKVSGPRGVARPGEEVVYNVVFSGNEKSAMIACKARLSTYFVEVSGPGRRRRAII